MATMRPIANVATAILTACLLFAGPAASTARSRAAEHARVVMHGVVVGVVDGDTADVRLDSGMIRIRFQAIDAPEMGQPYGKAAKARLAELIYARPVEVEPYQQDRYDRLVARLWIGERDINAEMVKSGHAWVYRRYADDPAYCAYEQAARNLRRGLWEPRTDAPVAPWEWRQRKTLAGHYTSYARETEARCVATLGK